MRGSWFRSDDSGYRVQDSGFRIQDLGYRVQGSGSRVQGSVFSVQGPGFRVRVHTSLAKLSCLPALDLRANSPSRRGCGPNSELRCTVRVYDVNDVSGFRVET